MASIEYTSSTPQMEDENTQNPLQNTTIINPQNPSNVAATPSSSPLPFTTSSSSSSLPTFFPSFNQTISVKLDDSNYLVWRMQLQNIIITNGLEGYIDAEPYHGNDHITMGNGKFVPISHVGSASLPSSSFPLLKLCKVYHSPSLSNNLLSVSQLCLDNNAYVEFHPTFFFVKNQDNHQILLKGLLDQGIYKVTPTSTSTLDASPHLLYSSKTSLDLWDSRLGHLALDVISRISSASIYLIICLPTRVLRYSSLYQLLYHKAPNYTLLRVFGCQCFPFLRPYNHHKLEFRSSPYIFRGYSSKHKGYLYLQPTSGRLFVTHHVIFNESCFPFATATAPSPPSQKPHSMITSLPFSVPTITHIPNLSHTTPPPSTSVHTAPIITSPPHSPITNNFSLPATPPSNASTSSSSTASPPTIPLMVDFVDAGTPVKPSNFREAIVDPKWHNTMNTEIVTLKSQGTWILVPPPPGFSIFGSHLGVLLQPDAANELHCFTDADWASCPDDHRSTSAYYVYLGLSLISWSSAKQKVVSRSSTESEYQALANGASDVSWIHSLLGELGFPLLVPPTLHCDNISTLHLASNPALHARTKHVKIDNHFVRERVKQGLLRLCFTSSEDQVADCLTKPLISSRFQELRTKLTCFPTPRPLFCFIMIMDCVAQEEIVLVGPFEVETQTSGAAIQGQTEAQLDGVYFEEEEYAPEAEDLENESITDPIYNEFDPRTKPEEIKYKEGMLFPTNEHLRKALKDYFVTSDREFKYVSNDSLRIRDKCKGDGCTWIPNARRMRDDGTTFRINKMKDEHNCGIVFENSLVDADWIAKHYLEKFRQNPSMNLKSYRQIASDSKYSKISSWTFYRAKNKARHIIDGSVKDQYAILDHDCCTQILNLNSGSTTLIKTNLVNEKRVFERVYICLAACKVGFKYCRPIIGLDGCFLKGYCKGMLLATIGIDANNSMFPLAYTVVEKENTDSWTWFLGLVKEDLNVADTRSFTFISDRHKGLEKALGLIFEDSDIRSCVRHLYENFKKDFPGLLLKQAL
uniref:Uncharacterized protein n=1 Tax=Cannabis sativa TaxID=3483 RepID=A0A803PCL0_CANSA